MTSWRALLTLSATLGLLAACGRQAERTAAEEDRQVDIPQLPAVDPPLDREALLLVLARAASDFAVGRDDTAQQRRLDGRRFELRLRFGCEPEDGDTQRWTFDEQARVLRFRIAPEISTQTEQLAGLELEGFEAVEGFWIRRPWLLTAACPAPPAPIATEEGEGEDEPAEAASPGQAGAAEPTPEDASPEWPLPGIAQFFTEHDSRLLRRDNRDYQATISLAEGRAPSTAGYDFVLSGRLRRLPDGRVIACVGDGAARPPSCIASAAFDHVALRRPNGEVLAEWSSG